MVRIRYVTNTRGGVPSRQFQPLRGETKMLKKIGSAVVAVAPLSAFATGPDLTSLTTAVDFGTVTTALLGVAAAIIGVYIAWKGAKMVLHAVKGA